MFCNEEIIAGFEGIKSYDDMDYPSFFDTSNGLTYYATKCARLILETEHYYISIGFNGVKRHKKTSSVHKLAEPDELIAPFDEIEEMNLDDNTLNCYESILFVGQRLNSVDTIADGYLLSFTNFKLKLIPKEFDENDPSHIDEVIRVYENIG